MKWGRRQSGRLGSLRRGFTLLEALMASAILLGVVTAVTATITAGQQHAYEAQRRIGAGLAAESLLAQIIADDYTALPGWHGFSQAPGAMTDAFDQPLPDMFDAIGRRVTVRTELRTIDPPNVRVRGRIVQVVAFDVTGDDLAAVETWVPEPAEDSGT